MMGADNLVGFHHWRDWRGIAGALPMAVFNRPGLSVAAAAAPAARALWRARHDASDAQNLAAMPPPAWVFLASPHVDLSSTAHRRNLPPT